MKVCTKCRCEKPFGEFARNKRKASGYQDWCKLCKNGHHQGYYASHKKEWLTKASVNRKATRAKLNELKRDPCTDCHLEFDPVCMDWDHYEDNKERNISNMIGHHSWEHILQEVAKCELVCACCHRLRTKARLSSG